MPRCAPRRWAARERSGLEARASARSSRESAADLVAVALRGPELAPCYDPVSHLVYAAGREHVTHVWVDGEARVTEARLKAERLCRFGQPCSSYGRMPSRVSQTLDSLKQEKGGEQ